MAIMYFFVLALILLMHAATTRAFVPSRPTRANTITSKPSRVLTRLNASDIFGVGPTEAIIIGGAFLFIYGPNRVKGEMREKGIENVPSSKGWKAVQKERVEDMTKAARKARAFRALKRINKAVDDGDEVVSERIDQYTDGGSS
jgi:hypothetical protein